MKVRNDGISLKHLLLLEDEEDEEDDDEDEEDDDEGDDKDEDEEDDDEEDEEEEDDSRHMHSISSSTGMVLGLMARVLKAVAGTVLQASSA